MLQWERQRDTGRHQSTVTAVLQARAQTGRGAGGQTPKKGIHRQNNVSIDRCNFKLTINWLLRNT